jgi:2'-5' RNA ligase
VSTVGVAIPVPEPWAGELQQCRKAFGDPLAAAIPAHITLVPPTELHTGLAAVEDHLVSVASMHKPFPLRLRGTATFRPVSPVVFVAVTDGISSCELLAAAALSGPLAQELGFPYHPHVTVAHHLSEKQLDRAYDELADFDCMFTVDAFHLYIHGPDGVWRPDSTYRLGTARLRRPRP